MTSRIFRPPPLGSLRLASVDDAPFIYDLVNDSVSKTFRIENTFNVIYLIENAVLSICQLDNNDVIVGFLAARDYPLIPSVHPQAWEEYIWTKYKTVELNSRNTLFIHLICWNPIYARDIVDNMLKSIFMHDPYVQHIAMVKSLIEYPLLVPGQSRSEASFRRVQAMERGVPGDILPSLSIADRNEVSPRLRIRRAVLVLNSQNTFDRFPVSPIVLVLVLASFLKNSPRIRLSTFSEEDNDDIVPIMERHSARLRQLYGDFYISELISRHPESERVLLVCEHKEVAVGVMCLNTQINYEALEESFELSPFAGLRHMSVSHFSKHSKDMDSTVSFSAINMADSTQGLTTTPESASARPKDAKSRITWVFEDDEFKDIRPDTTNRPMSQFGPCTQLDILNLLEDEEDELEFDIVNIDTDLLRVPKLLSYDALGSGPADSIMKMIDGTGRHSRKEPSTEEKFKKDKSKSTAIGSTYKAPEPIRYSGPPNAFLLELFAMNPDYDERYGFDMLEAAYELFPKRDYCVICLPSNQPSFPLLDHFTLVTPYCSRIRFINETLYVAHVNSVRGNVKLRPGEAYDIPALGNILEHAPRAQELMDLFETSLTSLTLQSYVLLSQNQPIGMVVLGPLEDGTSIRTQYDLEPEPRRPRTDATILAGVMSPALEPHGRWYTRELLRHTQYTTLFWICKLFAKGDASPSRNLMSLAGHMNPVHPRVSVPNISGNSDLDGIFNDLASPFALWVLERPLTSLPKVYVNNSIVVVGASRTGLAFLETLLMGPASPYLTFSNVTLVSEHGLPTVAECLRAADTCVPRDGRFSDRYLKSVPFYYYLDVMSAIMVSIDRNKKCIHLKGGGAKYYDELVLTCGMQFQHPDYLSESMELAKEIENGKPCERTLMDNPKYLSDRVPTSSDVPENVMLINSLFEANISLRKLMRMISDCKDSKECLSEDNQVIVYGECVEAYSCIASLLELGLTSDKIAFVEPFPPEDSAVLRVNCFNNETVDVRVQANIDKLGIRVLRQCSLAAWRLQDNHVEAIHLMSPLQAICLPCFAVFYYGLKAIDVHAFKAINECGLVYDGGLVVGPAFETNDPDIYGAGTCVRYSRRLYAARREHRCYCSEDVGEALAQIFLRKMDPFVMCDEDSDEMSAETLPRFSSSLLAFKNSTPGSFSSATRLPTASWRKWQPVKKFESPLVQAATVPGPFYYMKLRKPGIEIPMAVQTLLPHQGHTLITDKRGNYFHLQLNALHCVEAITCLSKKPFSSEIFIQIYGKHEAFFNKLLVRFQTHRIDDLYDFFTQPWMSALYQESFGDLLRDINEQDVGTVYELVRSKFSMREGESSHQSALYSCSDTQSCALGPKENSTQNMGTFRSVIDKFLLRASSVQLVQTSKTTDIPSECGQSAQLRNEAAGFWRSVSGERIVIAHLSKYLNRNSLTNPHYAEP